MKQSLSLWLVLGIFSSAYADVSLYVSADAAAGGDGSRQRPYQTVTQARDTIRSLRKAGSLQRGEAVTVNVQPGVYPLRASFELTAQDSGTAEAPVVYRAAAHGKASFQGGVVLQATSFQPIADESVRSRLDATVRDKVRVCDLSAKFPDAFPEFKTAFRGAPVAPWLYVNHQPMTLARWPNATAYRCRLGDFLQGCRYRSSAARCERPRLAQTASRFLSYSTTRGRHGGIWQRASGCWGIGRMTGAMK